MKRKVFTNDSGIRVNILKSVMNTFEMIAITCYFADFFKSIF